MSTNPTPNPVQDQNVVVKPIPWGKKYRTPLMNAAFWVFWVGFVLAHLGGTTNNTALINLSFLVFALACLVPLVTKK